MTALNKQAHQTENERMAQSLAERNGEPVEGLRQRISELEEIATDYGMKFQKAQDALKHQALLHKSQLEAAENNLIDSECHVAELEESLRDKQALLEAAEERYEDMLRQARSFREAHDYAAEIIRKLERNKPTVTLPTTRLWAGKVACYEECEIREILRAAGIGVKGE